MTRTVLVTGSSRGLGAVIAKTLAKQGFEVIINYNQSREAAEQLAHDIGENAIALQADVTQRDEVDRLVNEATHHFGKIDVVVNNALVNFNLIQMRKRHLKTYHGKTTNNKSMVH